MLKTALTSASIIWIWVLAYLWLWAGSTAIHNYAESTAPSNIETVELVSVVDGDTIKVIYGGLKVNIRILWVDTPEKYALKNGYIECFGKEASTFAQNYFSGAKVVQIRRDLTTTNSDVFKRPLRHVYLSGDEYAVTAIKNGYGFYTKNLPVDNSGTLMAAESIARFNMVWVWDKCDGKLEPVKK